MSRDLDGLNLEEIRQLCKCYMALLEAAREYTIHMKPQNPTVPLVLSLVACFCLVSASLLLVTSRVTCTFETVWHNLHNFH